MLAATPEHLLLDWDGLQVEAPPQPAAVGSEVTAYIRPEDIKILYPDRPLMGAVQHNQVAGVILESQASAGFRRWRVLLSNGHQVELRAPVHAYASLVLQTGQTVRLSLRREAVVVLQPAVPPSS